VTGKNEAASLDVHDFWFAENDLYILEKTGSHIVFSGIPPVEISEISGTSKSITVELPDSHI
jgi:hypothetical protein